MAYRSGLYTGVYYKKFQITDTNGSPILGSDTVGSESGILGLDAFINEKVRNNKQDSIVSVFMFPHAFDDSLNPAYPASLSYTSSRPSALDGYTPRNNKLLTYPYSFLCIDTLNDAHNYRYERGYGGSSLNFGVYGALNPNPEVLVIPKAYNGVGGTLINPILNPSESVSCADFPQSPFIIDAYRAWLAQKANSQGIALVGSLITAGAGMVSLNPVTIGAGLVGAASTFNQMTIDSTKGSKTRGGSGSVAEVATKVKGIYAKKMCVNNNYARMIDSFFDRYGYAYGQIDVPARKVRPVWTYTQTRDCSLHGNLPAEAATKIKQIFNKGITFWYHGQNDEIDIGDYSQANTAYVR